MEAYFVFQNCFFSSLDPFLFFKKLLWEEGFFFFLINRKKKLRLTDNALLWMVKHYESLIFN